MFPDLIDLGFLHLRTYGACMAVGFILCWQLIERLSHRKDLSNLLMALMISGIVGSRAAYVIEHWRAEFAAHPLSVLRVDQGGLMFYGGLILAIVVFCVWCFLKREKPLALADLLAAVIPLGHACGRIGCFFYGCCYGRDSEAWCAVVFPAGSPSWFEHGRRMVPVLPTQLFEAAALLALFAVTVTLFRFQRNHKSQISNCITSVDTSAPARSASSLHSKTLPPHFFTFHLSLFTSGLVTGVYLAGYAVIRFGIEYLRGDPRAAVGPFSISQTISLFMFITGAALVALAYHRRRG